MVQQYRPDIDGLRGIAVLLVVAYHAFPSVAPFGFLGVDVFFVISGYLITGDILRRRVDGTFTLGDFYMRRVRRLFPALITVLAATVAVGSVVLYPDELEQLRRHVLTSALFAQNFQLISEAGYWDTESTTKPLLHLWSLAVEEQFYLLWPLVLLVKPRAWMVAVAALASLALFMAMPRDLAYYFPFARFFEILAGALLAMVWRFPKLPTAQPWLVYVGLVSYPMYLWHWPALTYLRMVVPDPGAAATCAAVAVSFALAVATFHWIERPIRTGGALRGRARALGAGMAAIVVASTATALVKEPPGHSARLADLAAKADRSRMLPCDLDGVCVKTTARPSIALVGDSHADHFFDALVEQGGDWLLSYRASCAPLAGVTVRHFRSTCESDAIVAAIAADSGLTTVVLSFYGGYGESKPYAADHYGTAGPQHMTVEGPGDTKIERIRHGLDRTVAELEAAGKSVVLMLDVPELPFRPRECITRRLQREMVCSIDRAAVLERQAPMRAAVAAVQQAHPRLRVFDPLDALCDATTCRVDRGGMLVYRDSHHLTLRGSRLVAREFADFMRPEISAAR